MSPPRFDIAIVGGGPTGCALAILLSRLSSDPSSLLLFQSGERTRYGVQASQDQRVIAVNEGTRVLLDDLGAWPDDAAPIHTIHVSQAGRLGRTLIRDQDMQVPALGYVVRYASLHAGLLEAAQRCGITLRTGGPAQMSQDSQANPQGQDKPAVQIEQDGQTYQARIGVKADGMRKHLRRESYDQVALIGQVTVSHPMAGWAYERFTRNGPFAILPHPDGPQTQSVVWCCKPDQGKALLALDAQAFARTMQSTFGDRLGTLTPVAPFVSFALYKSFDEEPVQGEMVSIGNAAQTLHPVAGQGLNLGLRDAATLAHCLRDWIARTEQPSARALEIFAKLREQDRRSTSGLTDLMSRIFTTGLPPVEHAAGLTLLGLDLVGPARSVLARHLMQGIRA
ncbi:FAD-dependent monooxygenase [Orrella marina]|uniref:Monooxygenase n=1 Tax=Orrella marina TaxID=2163011 RepID=A0A2R4XNU2_9BURK|nr:FAD-dependent monooxygenase [Orrella marina]AWB35359.1 monooxygenase [Orrella marina]